MIKCDYCGKEMDELLDPNSIFIITGTNFIEINYVINYTCFNCYKSKSQYIKHKYKALDLAYLVFKFVDCENRDN